MKRKISSIEKTLAEISKFVRDADDFIITTHVHPDGDCIASLLLFAAILKHLKKRHQLFIDDDVPKKFDFLEGVEEIERYDRSKLKFVPKVVVVLDASSLDRIGEVQEQVTSETAILNIDHHASNTNFGLFNAVEEKKSSTVEVVYALLLFWDPPVTAGIATIVYTGILCDTGRFLFPNTTLGSISTCAEMVRQGAVPDFIAHRLYCRSSQATIIGLASALRTLEFHFNGLVSCIHLSNGFLSAHRGIDTEGFVDYLLSIEGTEVEFFMCEKDPGLFRVSFRSKTYVDVNRVASVFGGGGHKRAAGCTMEGSVKKVKERILDVLGNHLR